MANGGWQMADGRWRMADGRWRMVDGGWQMPRQKGPPTFPGCQEVGGPFPLPIVEGRLNSNCLYFSLPVAAQASQAIDTQPGARHRRRTPTIHRGRAHRTISAGCFDEIQQVGRRNVCNAGQDLVGSHGGRRHAGVDGSLNSGFLYFSLPHARPVPVKHWSCTSWFGQWSPDPPSSATAGLPVPDRRRVTWRAAVSRTAGSGDPRRTKCQKGSGEWRVASENGVASGTRTVVSGQWPVKPKGGRDNAPRPTLYAPRLTPHAPRPTRAGLND